MATSAGLLSWLVELKIEDVTIYTHNAVFSSEEDAHRVAKSYKLVPWKNYKVKNNG